MPGHAAERRARAGLMQASDLERGDRVLVSTRGREATVMDDPAARAVWVWVFYDDLTREPAWIADLIPLDEDGSG